GKAYWRIMADLNPSIPHDEGTQKFENALRAAGGEHFAHGKAQGEKHFYIPALGRHRGVSHFYLEEFDSGDFERDCAFARAFGERICDTYGEIVTESIAAFPAPSEEDKKKQLAYHTLYFFQVLTLDRGTTSGLLVHSDNDVGILGSLPAQIDRSLLESWRDKVPAEQKALVQTLLDALPAQTPCTVDEAVKAKLASDIRTFYQRHPEAQEFLARGDVVAPTTANHR